MKINAIYYPEDQSHVKITIDGYSYDLNIKASEGKLDEYGKAALNSNGKKILEALKTHHLEHDRLETLLKNNQLK
jgi:hypothetical protein